MLFSHSTDTFTRFSQLMEQRREKKLQEHEKQYAMRTEQRKKISHDWNGANSMMCFKR